MQIKCYNLTTILYLLHSKAPAFHSWKSPKIKTLKKIKVLPNQCKKESLKATTEGSSKAISTSKIKKIIVIKKKRSEKGIRPEWFGSNPHSNGEDFSRFNLTFLESTSDKISTNILIVKSKITKKLK